MSITTSSNGSWDETEAWLKKMSEGPSIFAVLEKYGAAGVAALQAATPKEEGDTAAAWYYEIIQDATSWSIVWGNSNINEGRPVAILIEYGHGTGTGGYVAPRPYITQALQSIYDQATAEGMRVVMSS